MSTNSTFCQFLEKFMCKRAAYNSVNTIWERPLCLLSGFFGPKPNKSDAMTEILLEWEQLLWEPGTLLNVRLGMLCVSFLESRKMVNKFQKSMMFCTRWNLMFVRVTRINSFAMNQMSKGFFQLGPHPEFF